MPILRIEIVGDSRKYPSELAQRIADAAGSVLGSGPQGTWVTLQFFDESAYAESSGAVEGRPMIVSLIQAEPPAGEALRRQVSSLAGAIARAADHPVERVHIVIEPAAKGRIAFGGDLVE